MTLYLGPERSGVEWLLDPTSERLREIARQLADRTETSPCDPDSVAADLDALPDLLLSRHFGIATGLIGADTAAAAVRLIAAARDRVSADQPTTWGEALGDLGDELRICLRDRHILLRGSRPSRIRAGEPAAAVDDAAPAVEVTEYDGVLCVTLRRLYGGSVDDAALTAWSAAGAEHFRADRIIVDLRGNGGGNDGFMYDWMLPAVPADRHLPGTDDAWQVQGSSLSLWNSSALIEAEQGIDEVPAFFRKHGHAPDPADVLTRQTSDDEELSVGERPWNGRMIVLTDANTRSSGESSSWALRHALNARVLGGPTAGMIEYGNITPYLLPVGGLHINLATKHNDFGIPVELTGFPVDAPLDPAMPLESVAQNFDRLHDA